MNRSQVRSLMDIYFSKDKTQPQQSFALEKTSWRRLSFVLSHFVLKTYSRRIKNVLIKTNTYRNVSLDPTIWRRLHVVLVKQLTTGKFVLAIRLLDVLKTSSSCTAEILDTKACLDIIFLTLFRMGLFGAAYGWVGRQKAPPPPPRSLSLKSVTHFLHWWNLLKFYLT